MKMATEIACRERRFTEWREIFAKLQEMELFDIKVIAVLLDKPQNRDGDEAVQALRLIPLLFGMSGGAGPAAEDDEGVEMTPNEMAAAAVAAFPQSIQA